MTILRADEHRVLKTIQLSGSVLDLGGDKRSEYQDLFKGNFTLVTANLDEKTQPDILADLEKPLSVPDASYDGVLLINVLEHIYEYRALLTECARAVKPGAKIVIIVPYMFPYHPSPGDFYRYSKVTLERLLVENSFTNIRITPLGSGVFAARWIFLERLLPSRLQDVLAPVTHTIVHALDSIFTDLARTLGKSYDPSDYALGFCVEGEKNS